MVLALLDLPALGRGPCRHIDSGNGPPVGSKESAPRCVGFLLLKANDEPRLKNNNSLNVHKLRLTS